MTHALLWAATAGVSYRESCARADLAPCRTHDLWRTANRMGLCDLHMRRKLERSEILEAAWSQYIRDL